MKWAFIPYYGLACILALVLAGYAGSIATGSHVFVLAGLMFLAYYLWAAVLRKWRLAYFVGRANRLAPPLDMTVRADSTGIHFEDGLSSRWLDWRLIRDAVVVPEGVFVTFGMSGGVIPIAAFADQAQRDQFVDLVRENAAAPPA